MWQQLQDELAPDLVIIAVALDPDVEAVRKWSEGIDLRVVIDARFEVAEAYGFVNVPATVWIDEEGRIARPADTAMADDRFRAFTNVDSSVHHDALRRWVREGVRDVTDEDVRRFQEPPGDDLQRARLHRRIALELRDRGDVRGMEEHLDAAERLAPWDWTIQRGDLPLRGEDPFGQRFFDFMAAFNAAGRPDYYRMATGLQDPDSGT